MKKIDIHTHLPKDDPEMEGYIRIMDRFEVVAALVHALPTEGRDNADVLRAVRAHPDRLFGSVHVDLREPVEKSIDLAREYAAHGFRSVKLFPNMGFDANDEHLEPFWAAVEELGFMCLPHCGWLLHRKERAQVRLDSLTATPFHFEVPARRHEGVRFVFGHFGGAASYLETIVLCSRLTNAFADTCPGWGRWVFQNRLPGLESATARTRPGGRRPTGPWGGRRRISSVISTGTPRGCWSFLKRSPRAGRRLQRERTSEPSLDILPLMSEYCMVEVVFLKSAVASETDNREEGDGLRRRRR